MKFLTALGWTLVLSLTMLVQPRGAAAWSLTWCQNNQDGHPTAAGTAWCAAHAASPTPQPTAPPTPQPTAPPTSVPSPVGGAHSAAPSSPAPEVEPGLHQGQHQTLINAPHTSIVNTATSTASASANGGGAQITNYVGGGYQGQVNLPVAPLADCNSGASASIGGTIGHDSGFIPMTNSELYAVVTFPLGRRHCPPVLAPVAPVTNIYTTISAPIPVAAAPPVIIRAVSPVRYVERAPRCAYMSRAERNFRLGEIHALRRHRHASRAIARDLQALRAACVPDTLVGRAIDG